MMKIYDPGTMRQTCIDFALLPAVTEKKIFVKSSVVTVY